MSNPHWNERLCIESNTPTHSKLLPFRVGVCWRWERTSGVHMSVDPWVEIVRLSRRTVFYSALKGNLELVFPNTAMHKLISIIMHTRRHVHTQIQTHQPGSLATCILGTGNLAPLLLSFSPLASHFSVIKGIQFLSLDKLWISLCPSVSCIVLASACLGLFFFLPLSICCRLFSSNAASGVSKRWLRFRLRESGWLTGSSPFSFFPSYFACTWERNHIGCPLMVGHQ